MLQQVHDRAGSPDGKIGARTAPSSRSGAEIVPKSLRIRGAEVDLARGTVRAPDGTVTELRRQSVAVLRSLSARRGETVDKDALHEAVWGGVAVTDDSLVQCIGDIRRALGPAREALRTVQRQGYRLEPEPTAAPAPPARGWRLLAIAGAVVLAMAVLLASGLGRAPRSAATGPVVAVLPFENRSGGARWDRLANGVTEEVIGDLGGYPWIFVYAAATGARQAGATPEEVHAALGVDYVVTGSVQAEGDRVRVAAALADAESGRLSWARSWDGPADDLLALQAAAADAMAAELAATYTGAIATAGKARANAKPTTSLAAYDLYLLGVEHKHRFTEPDLRLAKRYYLQSAALDPGFARTWVGLSIVDGFLTASATSANEVAALMAEQRGYVERAVAIDPDDPMVLLEQSRMLAIDGDRGAAERAIRRAVVLAPNDADVLAIAAWSGPERAPLAREAVAWADRAIALNPERPAWYMAAKGQALFAAGEDAAAIAALAEGPEDFVDGWVMRAVAEAALGDSSAAAEAAARVRRLVPDFSLDVYLAGWPWEPGLRNRLRAGARAAGLDGA